MGDGLVFYQRIDTLTFFCLFKNLLDIKRQVFREQTYGYQWGRGRRIIWEFGIDIYTLLHIKWTSLVAQMVKNPPAMWETWIQSLGWEDPLKGGMATHSSILAWRIPMDRGAWRATVHVVTKSVTRQSD